jgi:hypothetical protein
VGHEQSASVGVEIVFVELERFADPQPGAPKHNDHAAEPDAFETVPGGAHHGDDLVNRWGVGRVSHTFVAR